MDWQNNSSEVFFNLLRLEVFRLSKMNAFLKWPVQICFNFRSFWYFGFILESQQSKYLTFSIKSDYSVGNLKLRTKQKYNFLKTEFFEK